MKAVDPTIKLMGPETSQWNASLATTPKDSAGRDWMTEFLKANGDLVDIVTVHRYPMYSPTNGPVTVQQLRDDTRTWLAQIDYLNTLVFQLTGKHLPQAWTEVNSDPSSAMFNPASPDSFYNAIWYADVLGQMIQGKVFMVNQWVISQRSGGLGLLYGADIRPTFYVFPLYKNFGSEQVFAASGVQGCGYLRLHPLRRRSDLDGDQPVGRAADPSAAVERRAAGRCRCLAAGCDPQCRPYRPAVLPGRRHDPPAAPVCQPVHIFKIRPCLSRRSLSGRLTFVSSCHLLRKGGGSSPRRRRAVHRSFHRRGGSFTLLLLLLNCRKVIRKMSVNGVL